MTGSFTVRNAVNVTLVIALVLLPVYSQMFGDRFILTLFTRIVIMALAAVSLNLILGYGGMMSFGHAAGCLSAPGNSNLRPSNQLCGSMMRASVTIGSAKRSDQGCADSCARCSGEA